MNGYGGWRHNNGWPRVATLAALVRRACQRPKLHEAKQPTRPKAHQYEAQGGPYHGKRLMLVDGSTAVLRFRDGTVGKYFCGVPNTRGRHVGTTVWHAMGGRVGKLDAHACTRMLEGCCG